MYINENETVLLGIDEQVQAVYNNSAAFERLFKIRENIVLVEGN